MRKQKDRCIAADAAGDTEAFTAASIKLRRQKDIYEDFCKAAGTYTEYERTFVTGYNRRLGAKTGAITRTKNKLKNAYQTLTNLGENVTIDEKKKIFKSLLKSNSIDLTLKLKKQADHILGSDRWHKRLTDNLKNGTTPTSMFYESLNINDLLKKYSGKGEIIFRNIKQIYPIEFVSANDYVGKVWDSGLNRYVNTKRFVIQYSKDGVHAHPVKETE